jgi:2'-5' RNA ligase
MLHGETAFGRKRAMRSKAAPWAAMSSPSRAGNRALHRCFIALLPDTLAREQLDALARALERACPGARRVAGQNLHLTLAFIGALEPRYAPPIQQYLAAIPRAQGSWTIDRVACFERARVAWAGGPSEPQLSALAQVVRDGLDELGVGYDRKAFLGHVTLLRRAMQFSARDLAQPVRWTVTRPVLMVSETDEQGRPRYRPWAGSADKAA